MNTLPEGDARRADATLYLDASKMNFGGLRTDFFKQEGVSTFVNLFKNGGLRFWQPGSTSTIYALGQTKMTLLNRESGAVRVDNGTWSAYDWSRNVGNEEGVRDALIRGERAINNLTNAHGVPVQVYGTGHIPQPYNTNWNGPYGIKH